MSVARLVVSPEARTDIDDILDLLESEAGRPVALRYAERFHAAFRHLVAFPETGARRPGLVPAIVCAGPGGVVRDARDSHQNRSLETSGLFRWVNEVHI